MRSKKNLKLDTFDKDNIPNDDRSVGSYLSASSNDRSIVNRLKTTHRKSLTPSSIDKKHILKQRALFS